MRAARLRHEQVSVQANVTAEALKKDRSSHAAHDHSRHLLILERDERRPASIPLAQRRYVEHISPLTLGRMNIKCDLYTAFHWAEERVKDSHGKKTPNVVYNEILTTIIYDLRNLKQTRLDAVLYFIRAKNPFSVGTFTLSKGSSRKRR